MQLHALTFMQFCGYNKSMKTDYLKPENYGKLFVFMGYENVLALRVSLETGLRIGDVLKLTPRDLKGRTIYYRAQKTGKKGSAVISQDLANRLREISGTVYIFTKRGDQNDHRVRQTVWKDVKKAAAALRAAGVITSANIAPHSARRTFAVEDAEKNGIRHTQRALQHSSKYMTRLYTDSDKATTGVDMQELIYRLDTIDRKISFILEKLADIGNSVTIS